MFAGQTDQIVGLSCWGSYVSVPKFRMNFSGLLNFSVFLWCMSHQEHEEPK